MDKPYLNGTIKLDELALRKTFIYNLNKINPILTQLTLQLPHLAKASYYGDLQNAITELLAEVKVQVNRIEIIFKELRVIPDQKISLVLSYTLKSLLADKNDLTDNLSKDLYLVFHIQKLLSIKKSYYSVLKSIAGSLNNIDIKQCLQYNHDECEDNQVIFKLIAKEYMESSINHFLS
ncbi:MAG: DUF892 family protein [Sphingobacteriaceae bacterium]|nr:MAG: DUF892 family protein [Sphingobacteriaceae bacterium]